MTGFLNSLKADLLDRRLLPLVVVVVVGLVAAIGYVALGGGSNESSSSGQPSTTPATAAPGITVSELHPEKAVAETTGGVSQQQHAKYARNPFTPLPQPAEKKTATTAAASAKSESSPSASSESSSKEPSTSSNESPSSSKSTPTPPPSKPVYHVALLFGIMPQPETPEGEQQLTPYVNLKLLAPLPSPTQALIVYRGVTAGGKTATFTLVSEAILHGSAKCLPSEAQCQVIELTPGQSETLEYPTSTGQPLVYKLVLVSITVSKGSSANVESAVHHESKAGRELLAHEGLTELPGLRYSARQGVLVLVGHPPFGKGGHRRHRR